MTPEDYLRVMAQMQESQIYMAQNFDSMRNARQPTPHEEKLAAAKAWLASRPLRRYVPGVPTVLVPVAASYVKRVQERHGERRT